MPNFSKQIVYLSQAQYQELITNGTITVNGVTVEYNENDIYVTPQAEPVTDVQIYGISVANNGIANIPIRNWAGDSGLQFLNGYFDVNPASNSDIKGSWGTRRVLTPDKQDKSTFYGLAKAAGDSTQSASSNAVGTYTDDAKQKIQNMLGITDLLSTEETTTATAAHALNSLFLMGGKLYKATAAIAIGDAVEVGTNCQVVKADEVFVKNTDYASANSAGIMKVNSIYGLVVDINSKQLQVNGATISDTKSGLNGYKPIVSTHQHEAAFYGLAKAAGADEKDSTLSVGTYTETAKTAIRTMLGAASPDVIAISDTQPTNTDTKVWLPETQAAGVEVPTMADMNTALAGKVSDVQVNGTSITSNGVANIQIGNGLRLANNSSYAIMLNEPTLGDIRSAVSTRALRPSDAYIAVFYGLAKLAGDTTQANVVGNVGTYTDDAKAAIQTMLGVPGDVQVNGTSVVSSGVANIPVASTNDIGAIKLKTGRGVLVDGDGALYIDYAGDAVIKAASNNFLPITAGFNHKATFYGLAKAAGDTTQSASSNAVGTYTDSAKASIKSMLGIVDGSTGTVDITGTTPSITAVENTRYVCGEVSTLSFTPAASGTCIVRFTSGSTATVLTVPNTVKFPEWFDITALEADTIYEICITDGVYGAVMSWAL